MICRKLRAHLMVRDIFKTIFAVEIVKKENELRDFRSYAIENVAFFEVIRT
jgi:hypothetical protein